MRQHQSSRIPGREGQGATGQCDARQCDARCRDTRGGAPADRLPESLVPQTVADEYELQNRLNVYLSQAGVGPVVGHKFDCSTKVMRDYLKIGESCVGEVFAAMEFHERAGPEGLADRLRLLSMPVRLQARFLDIANFSASGGMKFAIPCDHFYDGVVLYSAAEPEAMRIRHEAT